MTLTSSTRRTKLSRGWDTTMSSMLGCGSIIISIRDLDRCCSCPIFGVIVRVRHLRTRSGSWRRDFVSNQGIEERINIYCLISTHRAFRHPTSGMAGGGRINRLRVFLAWAGTNCWLASPTTIRTVRTCSYRKVATNLGPRSTIRAN